MKIRATCFHSPHGAPVKHRMTIRMNRISVIGTSGSGKSRFADKLARILHIPHVELDALHWEADWIPAHRDVFRSRVREAVGAERWVVDGNYSKSARDLVWERADTIVWLDFSFTVTLGRVLRRTIYRLVTGEECCNGNHERLGAALSRDSVINVDFAVLQAPSYGVPASPSDSGTTRRADRQIAFAEGGGSMAHATGARQRLKYG
jgi:gluconate kinase